MTDVHTDGNGVAGLLGEILAVEVTTVLRRCHSCGAENPLAAHRAYEGAGVVLRCPACADVALRVGVSDDALVFEWRGTFTARRLQ
jgi:Zn finger protein HypA/HybF involved in hydrogenase expression